MEICGKGSINGTNAAEDYLKPQPNQNTTPLYIFISISPTLLTSPALLTLRLEADLSQLPWAHSHA